MFELVMIGNKSVDDLTECRTEAKTISDEFYSVQFFLNANEMFYKFRLRNISSNGQCILVKQDSPVFTELQVGDILDMEYSKPESLSGSKLLKTQITSKIPHNSYKGHSIVELTVIDNKDLQITSSKNKVHPIISGTNKTQTNDSGKKRPRSIISEKNNAGQQEQLKLF